MNKREKVLYPNSNDHAKGRERIHISNPLNIREDMVIHIYTAA